MSVFNCTKCGQCCQHLDIVYRDKAGSPFEKAIDEFPHKHINGVCEKFNPKLKLCMDYENRPLLCRVDELYKLLPQRITLEEWRQLNENACKTLQNTVTSVAGE